MITKDFMYCKYDVADRDELFDKLATELMKEGIVNAGFSQALKDREKDFPTGLPVTHGVAIPHTDGTLVNLDQLIFVTLANPIPFNEMGGDEEDVVDVNLVILLAVKDGKNHLATLQSLIEAIQKEGFVNDLINASEESQMEEIIKEYL
jgi:PTS system galactitol-specific IIA component